MGTIDQPKPTTPGNPHADPQPLQPGGGPESRSNAPSQTRVNRSEPERERESEEERKRR